MKSSVSALFDFVKTPLPKNRLEADDALFDFKKNLVGFNLNEVDACGKTLLHYAMKDFEYAVLRVLLDQGADINKPTPSGESVLDLLCAQSHSPHDIQSFLQLGAKLLPSTKISPNDVRFLATKCHSLIRMPDFKKGPAFSWEKLESGLFQDGEILKKITQYILDCQKEGVPTLCLYQEMLPLLTHGYFFNSFGSDILESDIDEKYLPLETFFEMGIDPNIPDYQGVSPVENAFNKKDLLGLKWLFNHGVEIKKEYIPVFDFEHLKFSKNQEQVLKIHLQNLKDKLFQKELRENLPQAPSPQGKMHL